jgi:hypothetical protein
VDGRRDGLTGLTDWLPLGHLSLLDGALIISMVDCNKYAVSSIPVIKFLDLHLEKNCHFDMFSEKIWDLAIKLIYSYKDRFILWN